MIIIRLNRIVIVIVLIIVAVGVEQDHGGSRWSAATDLDAAASEAEKPAESDSRKEKRDKKVKNYR